MGIIYWKCYNGVIMVPGFADDLRYLKFEFFKFRPHPRISLALERYAVPVAVCSRRAWAAALVYEKLSCVVNCMYMYVLVRTF